MKLVPGITRAGAASRHFCTLFGSPKTTAVTFIRCISATTSLMYSPFADGYSFGVHSSCTQPMGASFAAGSDAVNAGVFGHIGPVPGNDSSIACTWTSITGGTSVLVFCANAAAGVRANGAIHSSDKMIVCREITAPPCVDPCRQVVS